MKYNGVKDRIGLALALALFLGLIFGKLTLWPFTLETTDWAAKGQSISDRLKDKFVHFMPGAKVGTIIGFIIGLVIPIKWIKRNIRLRKLSGKHQIATYVIIVGIMLIIGNYIKDGLLFMIITLPIVIAGFWIATYLFGFEDEEVK
jgi:hypothetical protein